VKHSDEGMLFRASEEALSNKLITLYWVLSEIRNENGCQVWPSWIYSVEFVRTEKSETLAGFW